MTAGPLPIVIIGAGPIGLAAAAQLVARGLEPLAGDVAASRRVELVLPETGVCSTDRNPAGAPDCCTPATPQGICCQAKPALLAELPCCPAPAVAASGRQPGG